MAVILTLAKYPSRCLFCGRDIEVGEPILYEPGIGVAHPKHFSPKEREQEYLLGKYKEK